MGKEVSDTVVIEGTLTRDSLGNLAIHLDADGSAFHNNGFYAGNNSDNGYRKIAEDAFFNHGFQPGDRVKYVCVPVKP